LSYEGISRLQWLEAQGKPIGNQAIITKNSARFQWVFA